MTAGHEVPEGGEDQPFISHLLELRDRLLRMILAVALVFAALFPFTNKIYTTVAQPLMRILPAGASMIATQVTSPFLTPFKLVLVVALLVAMPYVLYQFWAFVAPGLYRPERRRVAPLVISSAFAYFVVFPMVFAFFVHTAPKGVAVMTDINEYLDFVLTLFFAFGLGFEVPIATILLVWTGVITPEGIAKQRPYVIVGAFILGMVLTPPDVISQTLLALPMWGLFELGLLFSRFFVRSDEETAEDEPPHPTPAPASPGAGPSSAPPAAAPFQALSEEEMEEELDRIERGEAQSGADAGSLAAAEKLRRVAELRDQGEERLVRKLLYEVLAEGDESQVLVARNVLRQLDEDY
jgi:sec-independent protein translocase protein TatC